MKKKPPAAADRQPEAPAQGKDLRTLSSLLSSSTASAAALAGALGEAKKSFESLAERLEHQKFIMQARIEAKNVDAAAAPAESDNHSRRSL